MRRSLVVLIAVAALGNSFAFADVPHTFSAGTPAKASEVNENFRSVTSDIESTNARVLALESGSDSVTTAGDSCPETPAWWSSPDSVSYQARPSSPGDSLTFGNSNYKIVRSLFREFGTGDDYEIIFPVPELPDGNLYASLTLHHVSASNECSNIQIAGYPAIRNEIAIIRTLYLTNNGVGESHSTLTASLGINIKVGKTSLSIGLTANKKETSAIVASDDYDFSDDLSTEGMVSDQDLVDNIDQLLDYIQINKVQ